MGIKKIPKFQMNRNDGENIGHDKYEWGKQKEIEKNKIIEAYDVIWNKNGKCITCGKSYEFIGSKFCSKSCYEKYFIPKFD